jgi:hypothetical protein
MPSLDDRAIRVENYKNVLKAFGAASKTVERGFMGSLREAVEPIREEAEQLAGSGVIDNLADDDPWTRMRTGVTRSAVYVAPRERGRRTRGNSAIGRPNLKPLLLDRAMEPALENNRQHVIENVEDLLGYMARTFDNVGPEE